MTEHQNKIFSAFIISAVTFLGFEALSLILGYNEVEAFRTSAVYLFLFHVFWIAFIFDLHLKTAPSVDITSALFQDLFRRAIIQRFQHFYRWVFLRHFLNYFVLPTILFWSTVILLFLNPFRGELKQLVIIVSTISYALNYWHMKDHITANFSAHHPSVRFLVISKLLTAFMAYAALVGFAWYFGLSGSWIYVLILAVTFFLMHQALMIYDYHNSHLFLIVAGAAIVSAWVGVWVYHNWTYQYFTAALILLAVYNTVWGFLHHYLEKTFSSRVALEYLILGLLVVSIIFATHNFGTRII